MSSTYPLRDVDLLLMITPAFHSKLMILPSGMPCHCTFRRSPYSCHLKQIMYPSKTDVEVSNSTAAGSGFSHAHTTNKPLNS